MKTWREYREGTGSDDERDSPEHEQQESTLVHVADALIPPIDVSALVPGAITTNALIVDQQRRSLINLYLPKGYSGTLEELRTVEAELLHQETGYAGELRPASTDLVAYRVKGQELARMIEDPLDVTRARLGLDHVRRQILDALQEELSAEKGLQKLDGYVRKVLRARCTTIGEANMLFPHLTLTELSFFPLLNEVPSIFLLMGTTYNPEILHHRLEKATGIKMYETDAERKINGEQDQRRIPQQIGSSVHGITYVTDTHLFASNHNLAETDPYSALGITDADVDAFHVSYRAEIREQIRALIPLSIKSTRLYERVWEESCESLQVGMGRIAALAIERVGIPRDATLPVSQLIDRLEPAVRTPFEEEKKKLLKQILSARVFDTVHGTMLRGDQVVRLLGILDRIPLCMLSDAHPFHGFLTPCGLAIRLHTTDGAVAEICTLDAWHAREAAYSLQSEIDDTRRENRTVTDLFDELQAMAQSKIFEPLQSNPSAPLSLLERIAFDIWLERAVALQILPHTTIETNERYSDWAHLRQDSKASTTMKIGREEALQYQRTLRTLSPELLRTIRSVRKEQTEHHSFETYTEGKIVQGTYRAQEQLVTLFEPEGFTYPEVGPAIRCERSFVLLHECAEGLWTELNEEQRESWASISWPRCETGEEQERDSYKHFLTHYSSMNPKEDFCDHVACFTLHGPEFRKRMRGGGSILSRKYDFIQNIFAEPTGRRADYPLFTEYTIEDIHGAIDKTLKKMSEKDAVTLLELEADTRSWEARRENFYEIRQSFHTLAAEEKAEEREADENGESDEDEEGKEDEMNDKDIVPVEATIDERDEILRLNDLRSRIFEILENVCTEKGYDEESHDLLHDLAERIRSILLDGGDVEAEVWSLLEAEDDLALDEDDIADVVRALSDYIDVNGNDE